MSAGAFTFTFYELDSGETCPIRVQPETLDLVIGGSTNTAGGADASIPVSAKVSGSKRTLGITPRKVTVAFTGTPPTGYITGGQITIPWLAFDTYTALATNQTGTYLGAAIRLVGKTAESVK